jgi:hypothetical protein
VGLINTEVAGPYLRISLSVDQGWLPRIFISNKFSKESDEADPMITF